MILALFLFLGGLVILAWLFLWARQRQRLEGGGPAPADLLLDVPAVSADDAVLVARAQGQLVYLNDCARRWLNLNGDEPDLEFIARLAQPADSFLALFGGAGQASFQLGARWVEGSSHRIPAGDELRTVVVLRELGAGAASAGALDLSLAMTVINRIGEMVNASQSVEQVLQTLLSVVREAVPADAGEVCLWDESARVLYPRGWVGEAAYVLALAEAGGFYREGEGISGWVARQRRPALVADTADEAAITPYLPQSPYRSFVAVPLALGERFIGSFELAAVAPGQFTQKDLALLQAVSKQFAIAIHNAELYMHQARYLDDIATLQQVIDQPGADAGDGYVRAVYTGLTERLARLIGADMCGVLLYNESRQALVAELPFYNVPDQIVRSYAIPVPEGSPQRAIWENQMSWHSNDLHEEPLVDALGLTGLMTVTGLYNTLLVPMIVGDRRIGVVQASNKRADGGFTLRDIQTMRMLATQAAVVAENARLYQQDQARAAELGGLQEISYAIGAFSQEDAFFAQINERIARLMGVALCGVLFYEDAGEPAGAGRLAPRLPFYGVDSALVAHYSVPLLPGSSLRAIWEEAEYWYTNRVATDRVAIESGLDTLAQALDIRQTMLAALTVGGRRLGVVQISNRLDGQDFTEQDARLLMIFATQAAALIENARLYRAVQQRADEAERLRRIAELTSAVFTSEDSFAPVLAQVAQLTESPVVFINVLDQHSSNLVTYPHYVFGLELAAPAVQDVYAADFERSVAISQRAFYSNDVQADERVIAGYREIARRYHIDSAVLVPLAVGERSIGEMGIANRAGRPYGPEDRQTLLAVAAQVSAALDRAMLYESTGQNLNRRLQELDAISRVSSELTLTLDLDRVLDVIRQEAARAAGADGSSVALLKPAGQRADMSTPELDRRLGEADFPPGLAPIEREAALRGADSVLLADYAASELQPAPLYARSAVAAAFLYADEVVGVIHLYHRDLNAFDARAADFLTTLAAKAALGYGNAVRYQEQLARSGQLRQRVEQLNQIFELGQLLHSSTDPVTMLEAIAYGVQHSVGYDVVVMLLLDEPTDALRRVAQAGMPLDVFEQGTSAALSRARFEALCQPAYRISESYLLPAEARAEWADVADTALLTQFEGQREPSGAGPNAWRSGDLLLVPLTSSNGQLLGLAALDSPRNNQRPTRADIEILEIFAHHAATTIENARLYLASQAGAEQEARLNEIMEAVASTLDQDGIIRSLAGGALRLVPFSRMTFALSAADADADAASAYELIQVQAHADETLAVTHDAAPSTLAGTSLGRSLDDGQDYLYYLDAAEAPAYTDLADWHKRGERTALVMPLVAGGERLGALHVGSDLLRAFGFEEFRPLLKRMANLAAVAIQNARLFHRAVELRTFNDSVVQSIQQGIIVLDRTGRVMLINSFMRESFAWGADAAGQDLFTFRPRLAPLLRAEVVRALDSGEPQQRLRQRVTEQGAARTCNFYVYPLGAGGERGAVIMVDDVTERAQLEHDLEARANQLAALTEVSSRITASLDYSEVVSLALSEMSRIVSFDTMTFWLRSGDYLTLEGAKDYEDDTIPVGVTVKFGAHQRFSQVVETQQAVTINRLQGWDRLPGESGCASWLGVPLVNQGSVAGVIALSKVEEGFYDDQAEQAAVAFANQVAVALANARLFHEAERRTQRLSLLNRVSVALVQSLDSEDILEIGLREIAQTLGVERSRALMFERDLQVARVVVELPRGDTPPDRIISLKENQVFDHIRRSVKALVVEDLSALEDENILRELTPRAITAYVLIPMAIGGQVIGAFEFEVFDGLRRFDPEQIDLGRIIANQAAIAIQNTTLLETTLVRSRELETLLEAAQATSLTLDVQEVYRSVVTLMLHALDMDDCTLMLWDDVDRAVEVQADINREGEEGRAVPPGTRYNLREHPALLRALEKREVVIITAESAGAYPNETNALAAASATAAMIVPLVVRDQALGLIQLRLRADYRRFSHREIRLAQALGAQAATAIENARLSTETANRVEELYLINELSQTLAATLNIRDMVTLVRERAPGVAGAEELYLALYDADAQTINFPLAVRSSGAVYEIPPRPLGDDEVSYVIRKRRPLSMGSDYFGPDELRRSLGISNGEGSVKSYLGVPLVAGDEVLGVLAIRDSQRTRAFGVNSQNILTTIATQLGAAIQNVRLIDKLSALNRDLEGVVQSRTEELSQERDRIDTLYRIASELARTLDLERVLKRSLEMVASAVGAFDGVIMQIDPATDDLRSRATLRERGDRANGSGSHPASALADWLVENQDERAVVVDDLARFEHWDASAAGTDDWRSALAVLLEVNDDIQGVMILLGDRVAMFTQAHIKLVVAAANQVAAAINNSDLYYLIRDQAERLGTLLRAEQEEAEKGSAILEGIADGVMLADSDGRIVRFNSAAERILDIPRDAVLGQPLARLIGLRGGSSSAWARTVDEWSANPDSFRPGQFVAERLEIGRKIVSVHLSPVHVVADEQFLGTVSVFRDITKEVEVDRMKSEFISNVSHELRTPMTSIKGYADLLLMGAAGVVGAQQEQFLKTIKANADRLSVLVNDLLNISRLDTGSSRIQNEHVELRPLLDRIVRGAEVRAQRDGKAMRFALDVPADLPQITADSDKLTQIFTNLVDNAYNYTYAGGSVSLRASLQDDRVLVAVTDTGIGIPDEFKERVWGRFERNEEHALVMEVAGTGLGLAIVKTLVEMHNGQVWFDSELGKGSTFYVTLPVEPLPLRV